MTQETGLVWGEGEPIIIYGAQMVAVSVYYAVKKLYDCSVSCFVVSDPRGNPRSIDGIPVHTLDEVEPDHSHILVAMPEVYHETIAGLLRERGFVSFTCIDSGREAELMRRYYTALHAAPPPALGRFWCLREFPVGNEAAQLCVFMSKCHKDKPLKKICELPDWIRPVQAGAALTEERIADLCDNEGDNISLKNVNYSELSVMYWASRHGRGEYLGLFHYRRMLDVSDEDLYRLRAGRIDAVLPYPTIHYPDIQEHHKRYLKEEDWEACLQAVKEIAPAYREAMTDIFSGRYFYNYNMLIAREPVFKDYCNWMFPILKRTEELSVPKGGDRADRYIGYLGENLTTLYFMYHQKDLNIAHTGRRMLL